MRTQPNPIKPQQRGVTLVEATSVVAILSIIVGSALPSVVSLRQRADLAGVAAQLETDVQFARSQAAAMNRTVRLTLRETGSGTCYMVHTGPAVDCRCGGNATAASCSAEAELLRSVTFDDRAGVQVRSASKSITFDALKGTVTPTATLRVEGRDGRAIHQVINVLGRVRTCSPQGRSAGEQAC